MCACSRASVLIHTHTHSNLKCRQYDLRKIHFIHQSDHIQCRAYACLRSLTKNNDIALMNFANRVLCYVCLSPIKISLENGLENVIGGI